MNYKKLLITKWIDDPVKASPLICFTNLVCDEHDMGSAQPFAVQLITLRVILFLGLYKQRKKEEGLT